MFTGGGLEFKRPFTDSEAKDIEKLSHSSPPWLEDTVSEGFVPLGQVKVGAGSLLVFPNCHAHRVLEMANRASETLRRRVVCFFVVDPALRIPSTMWHPLPPRVSKETALAERVEQTKQRKQTKQKLNPREIYI